MNSTYDFFFGGGDTIQSTITETITIILLKDDEVVH